MFLDRRVYTIGDKPATLLSKHFVIFEMKRFKIKIFDCYWLLISATFRRLTSVVSRYINSSTLSENRLSFALKLIVSRRVSDQIVVSTAPGMGKLHCESNRLGTLTWNNAQRTSKTSRRNV